MKSFNEIKDTDKSAAAISKMRTMFDKDENATIIGSGIGSYDNVTDNFYSDY
jgi:hypothetical protein